MYRDDQQDRAVAALLSAEGVICELSTEEALNQLAQAGQNTAEDDVPYGAVLHEANMEALPTRAGRTWQRFIDAFRLAAEALAHQHPIVMADFHTWANVDLGDDVDIVAAFSSDNIWKIEAKNIAPSSGPAAASQEGVYILYTHRLAEEMKAARMSWLPKDARVIMRVCAYETHGTGIRKVVDALPRAHDKDAVDGKTLSWRQTFIDTVACLTAEEIAAEGGHRAANTSATAYRWKSEGKIFSVRFGGKQLYPVFQFQHGEPRPVIEKILGVLPEDRTGWDRAYFFATPNGYLGQQRPMDVLDGDPDHLVRVAERHSNPADIF